VRAGNLAHGEQRALEVGLALATRPKLVLLDEPMAGMGPEESQRMIALIGRIRAGVTVLLVEHDMDAVFRLADRITVLVNGRVIATGKPEAIRADPQVRRAYLEMSWETGLLLEVRELDTAYGARQVLFALSFSVNQGEAVSLLGRNGMGKTTAIRSIMGLTRARSGAIRFRGERIERAAPDRIARAWASRWCPKGDRSSPTSRSARTSPPSRATAARRADPWTLARVLDFFPKLKERQDNMGNQLSGGEQQMLAIGRALVTNPHLLILDEGDRGARPPRARGDLALPRAPAREGQTILVVDKYIGAPGEARRPPHHHRARQGRLAGQLRRA
jgi:branched-chain amino acid transport system ATP-binding protein